MTPTRAAVLVALAMVAFAGNSLLCRVALADGGMDAASFTGLRIVAGALVLALLAARGGGSWVLAEGNWPSAIALFAYAAGFAYAYVSLPAGTGALLLFGAVQVTMIGQGLRRGEQLTFLQSMGFFLALAGLVVLLLPGISAPPLAGALLMVGAGVAWGIYSLRGQGRGDALGITAGNFGRAVPLAVALSATALAWGPARVDTVGIVCALASGALASGIGYAIWYSALPSLSATRAAAVQLSVPVLAAVGGVTWLGESVTPRLLVASAAVLGGIALVIRQRA